MKIDIRFVDNNIISAQISSHCSAIFNAINLFLYKWPNIQWTFKSILMSSILFYCTSSDAAIKQPMTNGGFSASELNERMRHLLQEHARLTREIIFCIVSKRPGIDSAVSAIVDNQKEMGHVMNIYYGNNVGKQFSNLLYKDITCAADVMIALKNGHKGNSEKAEKKWQESRDEILAFLTQVNPSWKMYGIKKFLDDEMNDAIAEIVAIRDNDEEAEVQAFDKTGTATLAIADILSETIVQHFPEQFMDQPAPASLTSK